MEYSHILEVIKDFEAVLSLKQPSLLPVGANPTHNGSTSDPYPHTDPKQKHGANVNPKLAGDGRREGAFLDPPHSRSAAYVAIALYRFLNFLKQHPVQQEPNSADAIEANRYLNVLRHDVIVGGLPSTDNVAAWIPLEQDPVFCQYHGSLLAQARMHASSSGSVSSQGLDQPHLSDVISSHPQIDPQTLYIPPLFSQLELTSQAQKQPGFYNPTIVNYTTESPQPPALLPLHDNHPSHPSHHNNHSHHSPSQCSHSDVNGSIPAHPPATSASESISLQHPSSAPPTQPQSTQYYSSITTNPLPTLRGLVWKAFVLGPLLINALNLGLAAISTLVPAIPSPYVPPGIEATASGSGSGSGSSFREGRQRDTSLIRGTLRTASAGSSVAPTTHHEFVNRGFLEEGPLAIDENDDGMSFSSLDSQSTASILSTGAHSASTNRQLNDSLNTTSSTGSMALTTPALSGQAPSQSTPSHTSVPPTATLTLTTRDLRSRRPIPTPSFFNSASEYFTILSHGKGKRYSMIRDDSFRTFRTDQSFGNLVPEQALIRVCNAFDVQYDAFNWKYCQGINVYAGMFLYTMPELDAYNCLALYCTQHIPYYWRSNHIGVEAGCVVLDLVLNAVDQELYTVLTNLNPKLFAILYAFSFVKTMSASASPLSEVVKLWDVQLAMGPFFNICCVAAQVISLKSEIMGSVFPKGILDYRAWPPLDANKVIMGGLVILKKISQKGDLVKKLQFHPTNQTVITQLTGRTP